MKIGEKAMEKNEKYQLYSSFERGGYHVMEV